MQDENLANEEASKALQYHKSQVQISNYALIAFLIVLVGFTLYRVIIEWNLADRLTSVEDYQRSIEDAKRLEQDLLGKQALLYFLQGKDRQGQALSVRRIRMDTETSTIGSSTEPELELPERFRSTTLSRLMRNRKPVIHEWHKLYSPFYKECEYSYADNRISVKPQPPLEYIPKAQAQLALRVLSDRSRDAYRVFCDSDPVSGRKELSIDSENELKAFKRDHESLAPQGANQGSTSRAETTPGCRSLESAARRLSALSQELWFPMSGADERELVDASSCKPTSKYNEYAREALDFLALLTLDVRRKLQKEDAPLRSGQREELAGLVDYEELRASLQKIAQDAVDPAAEKIRATQIEMKGIADDIEGLKALRPRSASNAQVTESFSLYQLLLGALFVFSALTAALTAAVLSRSHSFEVIEIERYLRNQHAVMPQKLSNPFSRDPKMSADMSSIKELLALLKKDKRDEGATK